MRNPKRIRPIWKCFIQYLKKNKFPLEKVLPLKQEWLESYDLRLGQLIWNNDYRNMENELSEFLQCKINKMLFHIEDNELMLQLGIPARNFFLWGKNFDEHGNQLWKTKFVLLKDIETDHLENIIEYLKENEPSYVLPLFINELNLRMKKL